MIQYDTHIHSAYSTDSPTPIRVQIDRAVECGLAGICLTDHMDYDFPPDQYDGVLPAHALPFWFDVHEYKKELAGLKAEYPDFTILTGVECGMQTLAGIKEKNEALTADPSFDYVIGSLHLSERKDPYYQEFWEGRDPYQCVRRYLEELYDTLRTFTAFDSLGHLDYIVRYAPDYFRYDPMQYRDLLEEILKILIKKDIALEVNTSGYKSTGYPNPHPDILVLYKELGGEMITIGSDAHIPDFLAYQFDRILPLLKKAGLHQYVTFHRRRPMFHPLDD